MESLLLKEMAEKCFGLRQRVLEMCLKAGTGHVTSSLSCVEILVTLYYGGFLRVDPRRPDWPQRDRLILSKGQASPLLYALLADLGFFQEKELDSFAGQGGKFGVHLQHDVPGVEITAGALGHGLGVAAGLALGLKMNRELPLVYVILGDGELYEGSIWESAMFASHHRLNNLVAIIDRNYLCTTDFTENLVELSPLDKKWEAFGWNVVTVDGHDLGALALALKNVRNRPSSRPLMVIAETTKGEGIACMNHNPLFHGVPPQGELVEQSRKELRKKYENAPSSRSTEGPILE